MNEEQIREYEKLKAQAEKRKAYERERYLRSRRALAFAQAHGASLDADGNTNGDPS